MIKATYGDQPTGFPGLGQDGNQSNGGPVAMETVAIPFPAVAGPKYGPSWALREGYQRELIASWSSIIPAFSPNDFMWINLR